jgi:hypothetical protein
MCRLAARHTQIQFVPRMKHACQKRLLVGHCNVFCGCEVGNCGVQLAVGRSLGSRGYGAADGSHKWESTGHSKYEHISM